MPKMAWSLPQSYQFNEFFLFFSFFSFFSPVFLEGGEGNVATWKVIWQRIDTDTQVYFP